MTRVVAILIVGLLIVWLLKLTRDQKEIWLLLNSLSVVPGEIRLVDDGGETNIRGGALWITGPHGVRGPELYLRVVPGRLESFPYDHPDGRVTQEATVRGGGVVMGLTTPDLPDTPLPPHSAGVPGRHPHDSDVDGQGRKRGVARGRSLLTPPTGRSGQPRTHPELGPNRSGPVNFDGVRESPSQIS